MAVLLRFFFVVMAVLLRFLADKDCAPCPPAPRERRRARVQAKKAKSAAVPKARMVPKARRGWQRHLPRDPYVQARASCRPAAPHPRACAPEHPKHTLTTSRNTPVTTGTPEPAAAHVLPAWLVRLCDQCPCLARMPVS
jgi:hypothetical protein